MEGRSIFGVVCQVEARNFALRSNDIGQSSDFSLLYP